MNLSGLSAAFTGYADTDRTLQQTNLDKLKILNEQDSRAGADAFGRTLQMIGLGQGGAQAPQNPSQPMAPPPGQPSMPAQPPQDFMGPPGPLPQTDAPMPQPRPMGAPQGGMAPMPGQASQPASTGLPPQLAQFAGKLDWQTIVSHVAKANPGAPPRVIAAAVNKFQPLMTAQALQDWRSRSLAIQEGNLEARNENIAASKENAALRDERARAAEQERNERAAQASRDRGAARDQRQAQFDAREARLQAQAAVRQDQGWQRLEIQKQDLARRVTQNNDRNALAQWRAVVDAQNRRAREVLQANSINTVMSAADKKALLDEQNAFYTQEISKMRDTAGRTTPPSTGTAPRGSPEAAAPKEQDRAPARPATGAPITQQPEVPLVPPLSKFEGKRDGEEVPFANGQVWALRNGQPERVR